MSDSEPYMSPTSNNSCSMGLKERIQYFEALKEEQKLDAPDSGAKSPDTGEYSDFKYSLNEAKTVSSSPNQKSAQKNGISTFDNSSLENIKNSLFKRVTGLNDSSEEEDAEPEDIEDVISTEVDSLSCFDLADFESRISKMKVTATNDDSESININTLQKHVYEELQSNLDINEAGFTIDENSIVTSDCLRNEDVIKISFVKEEEDVKSIIAKYNQEINMKVKKEPLPSSKDLINDFSIHKNRPAMLNCSTLDEKLANTKHILNRKNVYTNSDGRIIPVFSKSHLCSEPCVWRAPGAVIATRPSISLYSSVVSEKGIEFYFKVECGAKTEWYLKKSCATINSKELSTAVYGLLSLSRTMKSELSATNVNLFTADCRTDEAVKSAMANTLREFSDKALDAFVHTGITTAVYKRTSYAFFSGFIVLLKFIGNVLSVLQDGRVIQIIEIKSAQRRGRLGISVDSDIFVFSCERERDEWMKVLQAQ
ncbi:hypothetical protein ENBRE01_0576 [Enteropsectra breve]|nr:hypothetical protein ENBRE01_0576 [Enteropsectra breve]